MTKRNGLFLILDLIFLLAFNGIFFVVKGTQHTSQVWMCYIFLHFAYIMLCATPLFKAKGQSSYIMNAVLYFVTGVYLVVELTIGIAVVFVNDYSFVSGFDFIKDFSFEFAFIAKLVFAFLEKISSADFKTLFAVQVVFTAIYLIVLVVNLIANDATENSTQNSTRK